jgi:CDP-diacylglycerol---serine O-phosphatidyltransferase
MKNWRYIVPNSFTAISLLLGATSIVVAIEGHLYWAAWLVLWSVLLDKADGTAARLLNASSKFGSELDSMADLVAFGLAPAMLVYCTGRHAWGFVAGEAAWVLEVVACGVFIVCNAMRLARYNVEVHPPGERYFRGTPTTVCGSVVASALLVCFKHSVPLEIMYYFPVLLIVLGLGMVSTLPVPKVIPRKNRWFNLFQVANILAIYVAGICMVYPEYMLGLAVFYLSVGILYGLFKGPQYGSLQKESEG